MMCAVCVSKIPVQDRLLVKKSIVGLMLKNPESIQRQLSDAITSIGKTRGRVSASKEVWRVEREGRVVIYFLLCMYSRA